MKRAIGNERDEVIRNKKKKKKRKKGRGKKKEKKVYSFRQLAVDERACIS